MVDVNGHNRQFSHWIAKWTLDGGEIETSISTTTNTIIKMFSPWVIGIFLIVWVYTLLKKLLENGEVKPHWSDISRLLILIFLFFSYPLFFGTLSKVVDYTTYGAYDVFASSEKDYIKIRFTQNVNQRDDLTDDQKEFLIENYDNNNMELNYEKLDEMTGDRESFIDSLFSVRRHFENAIWGIMTLFGVITKFIMFTLIFAIDKFLYTIGPLAILFSMFPIWKDKLLTWLGTWLVVKFSFLTMLIVETIMNNIGSNLALAENFGVGTESVYLSVGMSLCSTVLYILSFWFTSRYIGSGEAGRVLSTTAAVTKLMAMKGISSAIGGSSDSNGKGSTIQALGNIVKGTVKDNQPNQSSQNTNQPNQ